MERIILTAKQKRLAKLKTVDKHLRIALAELNKIAGGTYIGSLRELKKLVKIKVLLDDVVENVENGVKWESTKK